ncbi:MAG: hypothetical protein M1834_001048 [Cirrosporium novae-zelandiae]|nr:MAG: hypothetical protein M1834_001048 [Cirrosporium novae-zelandiae]
MLPPRSVPTRIPSLIRPLRPPNNPYTSSRVFTQKSKLLLITSHNPRPQLPFLHNPSEYGAPLPRITLPYQLSRLITTERKQYIKNRVQFYTRILITAGIASFLMAVITWGFRQEKYERNNPSPPEWSFESRRHYRTGKVMERPEYLDNGLVNWPGAQENYKKVIQRLEDPEIDGKGIQETEDGGLFVEGVGKTGLDIRDKSEPWRRGYFEALMGAARCAENIDGWVIDKTRNICFPPEVVIGASNPLPHPVSLGSEAPPLEDNCSPASQPPEQYYLKILTTVGFSSQQRIDAAIAYADWLDFKSLPDSAKEMYDWALDIAVSALPKGGNDVVDLNTGIIKDKAEPIHISENLVLSSTSLAIHYAQNGDVAKALPIFLSVLRARRSMPVAPVVAEALDGPVEQPFSMPYIMSIIRSSLNPPLFPDPPADRDQPLIRTPNAVCEEAALMTYIGEILFSTTSKDSGLAWTRDAVGMAENVFSDPRTNREGKDKCNECLEVGMENWGKMIEKMIMLPEERGQGRANSWTTWLKASNTKQNQEEERWKAEQMRLAEASRRIRKLRKEYQYDTLSV